MDTGVIRYTQIIVYVCHKIMHLDVEAMGLFPDKVRTKGLPKNRL